MHPPLKPPRASPVCSAGAAPQEKQEWLRDKRAAEEAQELERQNRRRAMAAAPVDVDIILGAPPRVGSLEQRVEPRALPRRSPTAESDLAVALGARPVTAGIKAAGLARRDAGGKKARGRTPLAEKNTPIRGPAKGRGRPRQGGSRADDGGGAAWGGGGDADPLWGTDE